MDRVGMVQDHVAATTNTPLLHGFYTSLRVPASRMHKLTVPDDLDMAMSLVRPDGSESTFTYGHGLVAGYQPDGTVVVVLSVHDPSRLGVGVHSFHVSAVDATGVSILDEEGTIEVTEVEGSPSGTPTWFDPYTPQILVPSAPPNLPAPEVPGDVANARLALCEACPAFQSDQSCSECGCYMPVKVGLVSASCPLDKWGAYVEG